MTLGTPYERYDSERASQLLHDVGEDVVSVATTNLLTRSILSKTVRDPQKSKPGSDMYVAGPCTLELRVEHITGIKMCSADPFHVIHFRTR
jgi:hypothetical protein